MRRAAGGEREPQHLLGAGLADRAGHRRRSRAERARARRRPAAPCRARCRRPRRPGRMRRSLGARASHERRGGAGGEGARDVIMAVVRSPLIAMNSSPGLQACACRSRRRSRAARAARSARRERGVNSSGAPQAVAHASPLDRRPRALGVGKRQRAVADDLAGFMAFAGDDQRVARPSASRRPRGSPRRGRRFRARPARRRESRRGSRRGSRSADCRR